MSLEVSLEIMQDKQGPEYMPMSEWTRTPLHEVPGATATSVLPRILSYVERVGCSEANDGTKVITYLDCLMCRMLVAIARALRLHTSFKSMTIIYCHKPVHMAFQES